MEEETINELDYTEIDLVGDLSDTIRIEDKILFTVRMCPIQYFCILCLNKPLCFSVYYFLTKQDVSVCV